jgi:hypothetical protein
MKSIIFFSMILICFISCKKTDITPIKPTVSKSTNTTSYNENTNSYKTDDIPETDVVGDRRNCGWITVMEGTGGGGGTNPPKLECKTPFERTCKCQAGAIALQWSVWQYFFPNIQTVDDIYNLDLNSNVNFVLYLQSLGY